MGTDDFSHRAQLALKAATLTMNPGVYLMKDHQGSVIYVGKAKSLRNRVRSYFQGVQDSSPKTQLMVSRVADIETIVTPTEKDALILENTLIKKYRPRFNVVFRDDKEYPYVCLSLQEPYPTLTIVRKPRKDGALYFGPFSSAHAVRETVKVIHRIFPLRKCSGKKLKQGRPCMYYQLGQCLAPCCCKVDPAQYQKTVRDVQLFLQGRSMEVIQGLKQRMAQEAQNLNFEAAAQFRDQVHAVEMTLEKQTQVSLDFVDRDVFSFHREDTRMTVIVLFIRNGRMIGSRKFMLKHLHLSDEEILLSFVSQYYQSGEFIPDEIIVPFTVEDANLLEEVLREKKGKTVAITYPQRGGKKDLLDMARKNAEITFNAYDTGTQQSGNILREIQEKLNLNKYPLRIVCFDISNIMGTAAVGSMATFEDGVPYKTGYRRFRIKTIEQPDDYGMMHEVLTRYLVRAKCDTALPDLIIVDGGKGQLNVLCRVLRDHDVTSIGAAALAKGKKEGRTGTRTEEKIFIPNRKNPVLFSKQSKAMALLQRIRDEAHRFAISYHKALKKRTDFTSILEKIPGVGTKTAKVLLKHFGSIDKIEKATLEELADVRPMTQKQARALYNFLHAKQDQTY